MMDFEFWIFGESSFVRLFFDLRLLFGVFVLFALGTGFSFLYAFAYNALPFVYILLRASKDLPVHWYHLFVSI